MPLAWPGSGVLLVEHEIGRRVEAVGRMAGRRDRACRPRSAAIDGVRPCPGSTVIGVCAGKPEDDGAVGAVADAGIGERAVQAGADAVDLGAGRARPVAASDLVEEARGRRHRPHRVRTRRADADLEQVENRKEHLASKTPLQRQDSACSATHAVFLRLFRKAAPCRPTSRDLQATLPAAIWRSARSLAKLPSSKAVLCAPTDEAAFPQARQSSAACQRSRCGDIVLSRRIGPSTDLARSGSCRLCAARNRRRTGRRILSIGPETDILVENVDDAFAAFLSAGGEAVEPPFDIAIGRCARVRDPFGNVIVILDQSKGRLAVSADAQVIGVDRDLDPRPP